VAGAFQFVKDKCLELIEGKVSMGQLMISKSLRADYADPSRIAHKALADRIAARDPGNAPAAGDRIAYVYISPKAGQEASKLQGERIETPQFIKENGLKPDYKHYIEHQLQNPISQAFGLLLEMIPGFKPEMVKDCPSATENLDKYLAIREMKAAELLFSDCLKKLEGTSRRSAVLSMFGGKVSIVNTRSVQKDTSTGQKVEKQMSKQAIQTTKSVQTSISNFLLDSYLVDNIKKKERAKQSEKVKEAKEAGKKK
jgi:hypothetical protein